MMDEEGDMRQDAEMHQASDDWMQFAQDLRINGTRRKNILVAGAGLVAVILVIIISVTATSGKRKQAQGEPTYVTIAEEKKELFELVESSLVAKGLSTDDLLLRGSYQQKAFDWLSENAHIESYNDTRKLQRFALACFYYATYQVKTTHTEFPEPWIYNEYWLSDKHECDWTGIHCTASKLIHSISLERNNLTGKLPFELALLGESLKGLDLSVNSISMDKGDMDIFRHLPGLQKLLLDDNYLVSANGLPSSLTFCKDLRKLRLSYNLFDGNLDNGVLNSLTKLTHLEIEDNFLTGALPFLGEMTELRHIYLRKNALSAHLNFLKTSASHNMKELWLDGNAISQNIPSQIGKLTHLESLSISDAQLTGTLPTEFGNLSTLKRVWLTNNRLSGQIPTELEKLTALELFKIEANDLTGKIPENVCSTVKTSEYDHASVVVDCDQVKCSCCVECGQ